MKILTALLLTAMLALAACGNVVSTTQCPGGWQKNVHGECVPTDSDGSAF